jgi:hypothetical protein
MPTSGYSFTSQEITVRFRAPYISESLNQQFRGIVSAGVYEGFNPQASGTPLHIELATDPSGRSSAVAVSDLNPTTSVSVHVAGTIDLDLSAYASKTVAVCVDLHYAFPADTTGTVNIYDLGTETVPATSCVLAKVVVPAAGLIPAANINIDDRSFPFLSRGRDATPMVSVVRNGAPYLTHDLVGLPDFWDSASLTAMTYIASSAVLAPSGFDLTFRARKNAAGLGSVSGTLLQKIGLPVPTNRRLRLTVAFRPSVVPSVGNPVLSATITDAAGVTITTVTLQLDSAVVGVWETYSTTVQLPAVTTTAAVVKEVFVQCSAVSYTTVGVNAPIFDIADVDLQLEQHGPATDAIPEISGESHHTKVRLYEDAFPGAEYADLTYGSGETVLSSSVPGAGHTFRVEGNEIVEQDLTVLGSTNIGTVFASSLDAPAPVNSGSIAIGPVNATEVTLGRATKNVRVVDTLLVNTTLNPDSAKLHIDGPITVSSALFHGRPGPSSTFQFDLPDGGEGFSFSSNANFLDLKTPDAALAGLPIVARTSVQFLGVVSFDRLGSALDTRAAIRFSTNDTTTGLDVRATLNPDNSFVIGREDGVVLGGTPPGGTMRGTDRAGTVDSTGGTLTLRGGASTGTAIGGDLVFQTSPAGGVSGTAVNAPVTRLTISDTGVATFTNQLNQGGGSANLTTGSFGASISSTTGNIFVQASLGGNVSVSAGGVGTAQLRTTGSGDATVITVGAADAVVQATGGGNVLLSATALASGIVLFAGGALPAASPGDVLLGNALGSGGVSIFAGGTPSAPASNELKIGSAGVVTLNSASNTFMTSGNQFMVTAATQVVITSGGGNPITLTSVGTLNLTADGPVNITTGTPGGIISLDGIVRTRRDAGGAAFDIDGAVTHVTSTVLMVDGPDTQNFPTIALLKGIYNLKAMVFVDPTGASSLDLTIAASAGNIQGFLVNSLLEDSATHNEKLVYFSGALSNTFVYDTGTNANCARILDGTIEFLSDCTVTCSLTISGNDVSLKKGSFFRFFMIRAT